MASSPQFTTQPTVDVGTVPVNQATSTTIASNMRAGSAGDSLYALIASGPAGQPGAGVGKRLGRVRVYRTFSATSTLNAGVLCFYYKANASTTGQNDYQLLSEVGMTSGNFSQTTAQDYVEVYDLNGFVLPAGSAIYANFLTNTVGSLKVVVEGGLL